MFGWLTAVKLAISGSKVLQRLLIAFGSLLSVGLLIWSLYSSVYQKGFDAGKVECQLEQISEKDKLQDKLDKAKEEAKKEKHEALKQANSRIDALNRQLRNRPPRPTNPEQGPGSELRGAAGTGAGLHREDAEFLAGEATAAVRLQEALKECRRGYVN